VRIAQASKVELDISDEMKRLVQLDCQSDGEPWSARLPLQIEVSACNKVAAIECLEDRC
jgi:hypothetical protein